MSWKLKGQCILVMSSVTKTISQVLPQSISDILVPVALKRKISYRSDYIFEHINTSHVIDLFKLLKFTFKNVHYGDTVFSHKLLEYDVKEFTKQCQESIKDAERTDEKENNNDDSVSSGEEDIEITVNEEVEACKEDDSKMMDDSVLLPFGRPSEVGSSLVDIIATQIENGQGVFSNKRMNTKKQKKRRKFMQKLNLAPAEGNKPQNWLDDIHLDEKSFPHLIPSGQESQINLRYQIIFNIQGKEDLLAHTKDRA